MNTLRVLARVGLVALLTTGWGAVSRAAATEGDGKAKDAKDAQAAKQHFTDHVVVSATRTDRPVGEGLPLSVTVLDQAEIEQAPAQTMDDALRTLPGLNLPVPSSQNQYTSNNTASARGVGGNRVLVLLDGIPLNDAFYGFVHWNRAPASELLAVEFTRGSGASLFGNYAMAGVLNLVSRPVARQGIRLEVLGGSEGTVKGHVSAGHSLTDRLAAGLDASAYHTDGYLRTVPELRSPYEIPAGFDRFDLGVRLQASGRMPARFRAGWHQNDLSLGTPVSRVFERMAEASGVVHSDLAGGRLDASAFYVDHVLGPENSGSYDDAEGNRVEYRANSSAAPSTDVGAAASWSRRLSGGTWLATGADLRWVSGESHFRLFNPAGQTTTTRDSGGKQLFEGVFGEVGFTPTEDLEVVLSTRLDHWSNGDGFDERASGPRTEFADKTTTQLDPRLALRWRVSDRVALRGAAYRAFRAPTLAELYRPTAARNLAVVPNSELGPEVLKGGDAGADFTHGAVRAELNVFWLEVSDIIGRVLIDFGPPLTFEPQNVGRIRSQGVEAFGRIGFAKHASVAASYTFTDSEVVSNPPDPDIEGNQYIGVPRHAGNVSVSWRPPRGLNLGVRARAQSLAYVDTANQIELDAHEIVDVWASWMGERYELFAMLENALDETYLAEVTATSRLGAPRQFSAGIRLRLGGDATGR